LAKSCFWPGDHDDLARPGDDAFAAHPEPHRSLDDLEALLPLRMDVLAARDVPARGELEIDRQQLAVGLRCGPADGDPPRRSRDSRVSVL
jgi:hypothetical protein